MKIIESLEKRRSYYSIGKELPVSEAQVTALVEKLAELVPDAFNMKSSRVVVALGEKQDMLWNTVYDAFGGKVAREKIDSFRAGAGTVLYFYDEAVVQALQAQFRCMPPTSPAGHSSPAACFSSVFGRPSGAGRGARCSIIIPSSTRRPRAVRLT
ncbi:MAG: hypothetical protein ACLRZH_09305 [Ruthenibacterium lactatiformans]